MEKLKAIVDDVSTIQGRVFSLFIQILIIVSIVTFSIETLPNLSLETKQLLERVELFCVIVFTLEYALRIIVAEKKFAFVLSFFGVIDLIAILPFYLALGVDLRSLRALRLLRLFRLLKMARYNRVIRRFARALVIAREELIMFFFLTIILVYLSAVGIYYFENSVQPDNFSSVFDSLWWAVATLTTVGYGDIYPVTVGGKIFTFVILLIGLGIVAIPAGVISSALTEAMEDEEIGPDPDAD